MSNEKKYFTIAEVSALTNLPSHKIRYLDKTSKLLPIVKVRGRRYYTKECIDYLKQNYSIARSNLDNDLNNIAVKIEEYSEGNSHSLDDQTGLVKQFDFTILSGLEDQVNLLIESKITPLLASMKQIAEEDALIKDAQEQQIILKIDKLLAKLYKLLR